MFVKSPLIFSLAALVLSPEAASAQSYPATAGLERVEAVVEAYASSPYAPPGFAVAIVGPDGPILVEGYGLADLASERAVTADTVFYNASLTKAYTALAILALADQGQITLDAPLGETVPELAIGQASGASQLTYRSLLTHSFGLTVEPLGFVPAFVERPAPQAVIEYATRFGEPHAQAFDYANDGYIIADAALQLQLGVDYREAVQTEVLWPLGLSETYVRSSEIDADRLATGYEVGREGWRSVAAKPDSLMHAAGGMFTTANDSAIWLTAMLTHGSVDGSFRLSNSLIEQALEPQVVQQRSLGPIEREAYAFGWNVSRLNGELLYEHGGGFAGARAWTTFMPEHGYGVAVLMNVGNGGNVFAVMMMADIYQALLEPHRNAGAASLTQAEQILQRGWQAERDFLATQYALASGSHTPAELHALVGQYHHEGAGTLVLTSRNRELTGQLGELQIRLHPTQDHDALLGDAGPGYRSNLELWQVGRNQSGDVITLVWGDRVFARAPR